MSEVRDNTASHRFYDAGGHMAVAYYRLTPGVITFTHTEVAPAVRGRGIASELMRGALSGSRPRPQVVAACPFVAAYIDHHPEFWDLVATAASR